MEEGESRRCFYGGRGKWKVFLWCKVWWEKEELGGFVIEKGEVGG